MLVLARKVGERIFVGNDITIVVTGIRGDNCAIGIDAPASVVILREEVRDRLANSQKPEEGNDE